MTNAIKNARGWQVSGSSKTFVRLWFAPEEEAGFPYAVVDAPSLRGAVRLAHAEMRTMACNVYPWYVSADVCVRHGRGSYDFDVVGGWSWVGGQIVWLSNADMIAQMMKGGK